MIKEFRDFIMRGNVMDLAVAVIIGGAFGKIITSLVNDILMPIVGLAGGINFKDWKIVLQKALMEGDEDVTMNMGLFVQTIVDFLLVALAIFAVVKVYNNINKKKEEAPAPDPGPSDEVVLLTEIRDALKSQN